MGKIFLFFFILLALLALWFVIPLTRGTVACYKHTQRTLDDIGFRARASGWSERQVCEEKTDAVLRLAGCLETIRNTRNKPVTIYLEPYIHEMLRLTQPFLPTYEQRRADINAQCGAYPDFVIE